MTAIQPDLFGEYDAAQARRELWDRPHACPMCGRIEPNGLLLRNNHGIKPGEDHHPVNDQCTAQWLTTNHITHAALRDDADQLERDTARGRELGLDVEAIIAAAREQD